MPRDSPAEGPVQCGIRLPERLLKNVAQASLPVRPTGLPSAVYASLRLRACCHQKESSLEGRTPHSLEGRSTIFQQAPNQLAE